MHLTNPLLLCHVNDRYHCCGAFLFAAQPAAPMQQPIHLRNPLLACHVISQVSLPCEQFGLGLLLTLLLCAPFLLTITLLLCYISLPTGITAVRQLSPGEGALLHVLPWSNHPALLLYASQRGGVHCCDLRCAKDAWHIPPAPSLGLLSQLVADPSGQHWLVQGTSRGWVGLWDVRFLLCVNSWQHPQRWVGCGGLTRVQGFVMSKE
jgi:hypothetical protein